MRAHKFGAEAAQIGEAAVRSPGLVTLGSQIGARRILDLLSGKQLPRIC
jgi:hydrogenase expression/formation protein HypE